MKAFRIALVLLAGILVGWPLSACLWDYDTIEMERYRFPETMELIAGKFLRHSPEFYEWRIQDRLQRLESGEDRPDLYDDLAVAYDKTGQHDQAIETMLRKEERFPGLYETYANLGTFYIHSGRFEEGLTHIDRAIRINPDAHFGREVYQKLVVEYVLSRMRDGRIVLPLKAPSVSYADSGGSGFAAFVARQTSPADGPARLDAEQVAAAVKGVLGMMHFGRHDSPILLECLADLLLTSHNERSDAKQLAAFAYLKASYEVEDSETREHYRRLAKDAVAGQALNSAGDYDFVALERTLHEKIREAEEWYATVRIDESAWIASGLDADEEFRRNYYEAPVVSKETPLLDSRAQSFWGRAAIGERAAIVVFLALGAFVVCLTALCLWLLSWRVGGKRPDSRGE